MKKYEHGRETEAIVKNVSQPAGPVCRLGHCRIKKLNIFTQELLEEEEEEEEGT